MLVALLCCCFTGCSDDDDDGRTAAAYDPNQPVTVTSFSPDSVAYGEDIVIYGSNFGNEVSKVKVTIGGKNAKVIGVKGTAIYCVVPQSAYGKEVQVDITDGGENVVASAVCEQEFKYARSWLVSTEIGTHYETANDEEEKDGPFHDCGIISEGWWFTWDPLSNFDVLYMTTDKQFYRKLDFAHDNGDGTFGYCSTHSTRFSRVLAMDWTTTTKGGYAVGEMIYSENHSSDSKVANYLYTRASGFTEEHLLGGVARGVNCVMVHPNGEMYFTRFRAGDVWRYDFETNEQHQIFVLPYSGLPAYMMLHPTGNYAYIMMRDKHYIMRMDYDWDNETFTTAYTIAGTPNSAGYTDGVGTRCKMNQPVQGVFVKNPAYAGNADEYDFYFTDKENHCVRILTPTGRVSTFAGRGNNTAKGYNDGALRTQAQFNGPSAIVYDEKRQCFYVSDRSNKVIRTIRLEREEDTQPDEGGETGGEEAPDETAGEGTEE